jgi:hypothetical protein
MLCQLMFTCVLYYLIHIEVISFFVFFFLDSKEITLNKTADYSGNYIYIVQRIATRSMQINHKSEGGGKIYTLPTTMKNH